MLSERHQFMKLAIQEAQKSPPKPTNFCVGACLVHAVGQVRHCLETGYTLECEGNTHAEQSCFLKLAKKHSCEEHDIGRHLPVEGVIELYTTMEPCNKRSVGNMPCVDRILRLKREDGSQAIGKIYTGVSEPETFVGVNEGKKKLQDAGIQVEHIFGFEDEILRIATAGHEKQELKG